MLARKLEKRLYTYGELKGFPENERWELIDGVPYLQAQPGFEHQEIVTELVTQIRSFLRGKPCRVVVEPAVWLEKMVDATKDYVVPDVAVVCDAEKIITEGIEGAPNWIVEVASPSIEDCDRHVKLRRYRMAGVKEYWIVYPGYSVSVHILQNGAYQIESYGEGMVPVTVLPGFEVDLGLVLKGEK